MTDVAHAVSAEIAADFDTVFEFFSDPMQIGSWTLGSRDVRETDIAGIVEGCSVFDGSTSLIRIQARRESGLIDYHVGNDPSGLSMRISARVLDAADFGRGPGPDHSLLTLTAWRPLSMDDARWRRLCAAHEVEILMAKSQLETGWLKR